MSWKEEVARIRDNDATLTTLSLIGRKVGNEGVMAIKSLANLTELDLSKSKVRRGYVLSSVGIARY